MVENVTVLKAMQVVVGGGFGHKSVVVRTNVARLVDKVVTQLGAERVMGSSKEFQASFSCTYPLCIFFCTFCTMIMGCVGTVSKWQKYHNNKKCIRLIDKHFPTLRRS